VPWCAGSRNWYRILDSQRTVSCPTHGGRARDRLQVCRDGELRLATTDARGDIRRAHTLQGAHEVALDYRAPPADAAAGGPPPNLVE